MDIPALVSRQREYFLGGATLEPSERKESLLRLQKAILAGKRRSQKLFTPICANPPLKLHE